ncbi:MAG: hypothetical protein Q7R96_05855 [Nanoarchaeota archaeon]|nr:hypothetical protein [Nanoarchaeota archaeon]
MELKNILALTSGEKQFYGLTLLVGTGISLLQQEYKNLGVALAVVGLFYTGTRLQRYINHSSTKPSPLERITEE